MIRGTKGQKAFASMLVREFLNLVPMSADEGRFHIIMEYQNFKLEIDEQGIAVFTANRPEKMNALNDLSWAEMNQFFTWADKADEVKVVIVTGAGEKAFIAGADLNSLKTKKSTDCLGGAGQKALDLIQHCSKPVIAAVNGYAFGGGCEFCREPAELRDLQD